MECKSCGKNIDGEEHKNVANWQFCLECFERLIQGPTQGEATHAVVQAQPEDHAEPSKPESGNEKCGLCDKEIAAGAGKKLGIWTLCDSCYQGLVFTPDTQAGPTSTETPKEGEEEESTDSGEEHPIHLQVQMDFMKSVNCSGCGRRIPQGGSRPVDGEPYCPDCYYALSKPEAAARTLTVDAAGPRTPASRPGETMGVGGTGNPGAGTGRQCESCGRDVLRESLTSVEGFSICRACLTTNPDLALSIARARHQKRLEQIRSEMGWI